MFFPSIFLVSAITVIVFYIIPTFEKHGLMNGDINSSYEVMWLFRNQLNILMSVVLSGLELTYLLTYSKLYTKGPCPALKKTPRIRTQ